MNFKNIAKKKPSIAVEGFPETDQTPTTEKDQNMIDKNDQGVDTPILGDTTVTVNFELPESNELEPGELAKLMAEYDETAGTKEFPAAAVEEGTSARLSELGGIIARYGLSATPPIVGGMSTPQAIAALNLTASHAGIAEVIDFCAWYSPAEVWQGVLVKLGYKPDSEKPADAKAIKSLECGAVARYRAKQARLGVKLSDAFAKVTGDCLDRLVGLHQDEKELIGLVRTFGDQLRFNQLKMRIELNGELVGDFAELAIAERGYVRATTNTNAFCAALQTASLRNSYNPVQEYLKECHDKYGEQVAENSVIEGLAKRHFGCDLEISQVYVRKFLISAVARALLGYTSRVEEVDNNKTKVDTVLTLIGKQGKQKSTWFDLLSNGWFEDALGDASDKDAKIKASRAWFVELGELNHITSKKGVEAFKAFLTTQIDHLRLPYGKIVIEMPRRWVAVATSNPKDILQDDTGSRRFWPIEVKNLIDREIVLAEREMIWAEAYNLYLAGEQWWLTTEEQESSDALAKEFTPEDSWEEAIAWWLKSPNRIQSGVRMQNLHQIGDVWCCTIGTVMTEALGLDLERQGRRETNRAANVMRGLGWERTTQRLTGGDKAVKCWRSPDGYEPED